MKLQKKKLEYKWVVFAACFMMIFVCLGFCSSNKGLYLGAITQTLGIKRSLFSINDSFRFSTSAIMNVYFGTLVRKFGFRKMTAVGFLALISAVLIYAYASSIWVFYIGGTLLGFGISFTTTAMVSVLIKSWFTTNVGTILGMVTAANGLGGALAAQIVTPIIYQEGNPFGYRNAYTLVAVIVAITGILVVLMIGKKPEGGSMVIGGKKKTRGGGWVGMEFEEAIRQPFFIPAAIGVFLTGLVLSSVNGAGSVHLRDMGLDTGYVATVLSAQALSLTVFKFLVGVLFDRKGLRTMLIICNVTGVIVMTLLAVVSNTPAGRVFAMLWGIFSALALPMETIGVPLVTSDLYGNKAFDKMVGIMLAVNYAGYAIGNPLMNFFYDINGTYKPVMLIFVGIYVVVTVVYQFVITAAHKKRKEIEEIEAAEKI